MASASPLIEENPECALDNFPSPKTSPTPTQLEEDMQSTQEFTPDTMTPGDAGDKTPTAPLKRRRDDETRKACEENEDGVANSPPTKKPKTAIPDMDQTAAEEGASRSSSFTQNASLNPIRGSDKTLASPEGDGSEQGYLDAFSLKPYLPYCLKLYAFDQPYYRDGLVLNCRDDLVLNCRDDDLVLSKNTIALLVFHDGHIGICCLSTDWLILEHEQSTAIETLYPEVKPLANFISAILTASGLKNDFLAASLCKALAEKVARRLGQYGGQLLEQSDLEADYANGSQTSNLEKRAGVDDGFPVNSSPEGYGVV